MKLTREQYFNQFEDNAIETICERMFEDGRLAGGDVDPCEYVDHGEVEELLEEWYDDYLNEDSYLETLEQRNK